MNMRMIGGIPKTVEAWGEHSKIVRGKMYDIYLSRIREKKPRFTRAKIEDMCSYDYIMSASEVVEIGLADKVI